MTIGRDKGPIETPCGGRILPHLPGSCGAGRHERELEWPPRSRVLPASLSGAKALNAVAANETDHLALHPSPVGPEIRVS